MSTQAIARIELSGLEKTAVLIMAIGEEAGALLLRQLPKEHVQKVVSAVAQLGAIRKEDAHAVIREGLSMVKDREGEQRGNPAYGRRVLESAFGDEVEAVIAAGDDNDTRAFRHPALDNADSKRLARLLLSEHPQVIAILVANLKRQQAAEILASFPATLRVQVAMRIARLDKVPAQVVAAVAGNFERRLGTPVETSSERFRGTRAIADLINQMDPNAAEETLTGIGESDLTLANEVRDLLFVFEDLINLDLKAIREIVSRADRRMLTIALKGTADRLKDHIMQTMSQRGATMMREDMEAMGPAKIRDVIAAQKEILSVMRKLEAEGIVSTKGSGEQQYVD